MCEASWRRERDKSSLGTRWKTVECTGTFAASLSTDRRPIAARALPEPQTSEWPSLLHPHRYSTPPHTAHHPLIFISRPQRPRSHRDTRRTAAA